MPAASLAAWLAATAVSMADAAGQLNVVSWRPSEAGHILICEDQGCSSMESMLQDEEPKALSPGKHMYEIGPGQEEAPSAIFGAGVRPDPRPYLLHVPSGYEPGTAATLWVHAPGTDVHMETVYEHNKVFAEKHNIAMLFLSGLSYKMNVRDKALSHTGGVWGDDVAYTQVCLRQVTQRINVDRRRIFCVGFSRGARFCSRLASELSSVFAAIAGVAGIRYPEPNNATKPIPIIAFHAMLDEINPYRGGGPFYWVESIPATIQRWGFFNGCNEFFNDSTTFKGIEVHTHSNCTNNATVVLYKLQDRGHNWPGGLAINVREEINEFFRQHSAMVACQSVGETEPGACSHHMRQARREGLEGLGRNSSLHEIQELMHKQVYADCPLPCPPEVEDEEGSHARNGGGEKQEQRVLPVPLEPSRRSSQMVLFRISMVCLVVLVAAVSISASFCRRRTLSEAYMAKCPTSLTEACAAPFMALPTRTAEPLAAAMRQSKVTGVPASSPTLGKPKGKRKVFVI